LWGSISSIGRPSARARWYFAFTSLLEKFSPVVTADQVRFDILDKSEFFISPFLPITANREAVFHGVKVIGTVKVHLPVFDGVAGEVGIAPLTKVFDG